MGNYFKSGASTSPSSASWNVFLGVVGIWWISVLLVAVDGVPPRFRDYLHHAKITHLFTRRVDSWAWFEIQGRFSGGEGRWVNLRLADYSRMENYGYLTRLDRILDEAGSRERGPGIRRELSRFIASAHANRFPGRPGLREVRFLRVSAPVGSPLLANPSGHWTRPPLETVPASWVREIAIVTDREWSGSDGGTSER